MRVGRGRVYRPFLDGEFRMRGSGNFVIREPRTRPSARAQCAAAADRRR